MRSIGAVIQDLVGEALDGRPDADDGEGKDLALGGNLAARERYIAIAARVDDLRFDLAEMDESDADPSTLEHGRDDLTRKIETLNCERRDLADGHSGQGAS